MLHLLEVAGNAGRNPVGPDFGSTIIDTLLLNGYSHHIPLILLEITILRYGENCLDNPCVALHNRSALAPDYDYRMLSFRG